MKFIRNYLVAIHQNTLDASVRFMLTRAAYPFLLGPTILLVTFVAILDPEELDLQNRPPRPPHH